jgi:hypothetical protein
MCVKSWCVHLCGRKVRHVSATKCAFGIEADGILRALDPSGTIRNRLLEAESRRLHESCVQSAYELHYIEYIVECEPCVWKHTRLGTEEVTRLLASPQVPQR